jgi:hypothetical protein
VVRETLADRRVVLGGFLPIIEVGNGIMWPMSCHNIIKVCHRSIVCRKELVPDFCYAHCQRWSLFHSWDILAKSTFVNVAMHLLKTLVTVAQL